MSTETQKAVEWYDNLELDIQKDLQQKYWLGAVLPLSRYHKEQIYLKEHSQPAEPTTKPFICLNCKDIWVVSEVPDVCPNCNHTSFQETHESNLRVAKAPAEPKEQTGNCTCGDLNVCDYCETFERELILANAKYAANQTSTPIRKPLHNIKGSSTYIGDPSPELENAVNKMAELAYESASTPMEAESVDQSDYFKAQMYKAFRHGRAFFSSEIGGDISEDCPDDNLPFAEWFAKYYKNAISNTHKSKLDDNKSVEFLKYTLLEMKFDEAVELLKKVADNFSVVVDSRNEQDQEDVLNAITEFITRP